LIPDGIERPNHDEKELGGSRPSDAMLCPNRNCGHAVLGKRGKQGFSQKSRFVPTPEQLARNYLVALALVAVMTEWA